MPYISLGVKVANLAQLAGVHLNTLRNPSPARREAGCARW